MGIINHTSYAALARYLAKTQILKRTTKERLKPLSYKIIRVYISNILNEDRKTNDHPKTDQGTSDLNMMPYLIIEPTNSKNERRKRDKADNMSTQMELNLENADNFRQSKVKESNAEQSKELPPL